MKQSSVHENRANDDVSDHTPFFFSFFSIQTIYYL